MKILIGTPIHVSKDYCMRKWLKNVSKLDYPADLFMVDNSPNPDYVKKVKGYCIKYSIKNYKIAHIELPPEQGKYERIARCREKIRQEVLSHGYDALFSWENDQIIPKDALGKLVTLMEAADFIGMVNHNNWTRQVPNLPNFDLGCGLIKKSILKKYSFILKFGTDPEMPDTWEPGEAWLRKQTLRGGGCYLEAEGLIEPVYHLTNEFRMKILIGTPIHKIKDYAMERWLQNVANLIQVYPADFLMVDNSPNTNYVKKVKGYCKKFGIKKYKIKHLILSPKQGKYERIARSREIIRQEVLSEGYDAWFCWECDQIIPTNALGKLIDIIRQENYLMVNLNKWAREIPDYPNFDFGCALIKKEALVKYSFILKFGTDPEMPKTWESGELWFKRRILRDGGNFAEVDGIIKPIYHLAK